MRVSTLKAKVTRLWVEVPGENEGDPAEKIWVDYRPGELTLQVSDELKAAITTGFDADVAFVLIHRVVAAWDLENDDGSQVGVTEAEIKAVPIAFLGRILQAIEDDVRPNPKRGATSEDGSAQTEPQEASQNGTSSSEQRTGSLVGPGNS